MGLGEQHLCLGCGVGPQHEGHCNLMECGIDLQTDEKVVCE